MLTSYNIDQYLIDNGQTPDGRYLTKDNGKGNKIVKWEYPIPKPTKKQLQSYEEQHKQQRKKNHKRKEQRSLLRRSGIKQARKALQDGDIENALSILIDTVEAKTGI